MNTNDIASLCVSLSLEVDAVEPRAMLETPVEKADTHRVTDEGLGLDEVSHNMDALVDNNILQAQKADENVVRIGAKCADGNIVDSVVLGK
ncbi:hypothetical protein ACOSP7_009509 [Xanthoceras sorbifolium]